MFLHENKFKIEIDIAFFTENRKFIIRKTLIVLDGEFTYKLH